MPDEKPKIEVLAHTRADHGNRAMSNTTRPASLSKALFLLNMNQHKPKTKPETKVRLQQQLRDACLAYLGIDETKIRDLAVEIGDQVDTPDFQIDPNRNADTINTVHDIILRWLGR